MSITHTQILLRRVGLLAALVLPLVAATGAQAARFDPLGFQIIAPPGGLTAHENGGQAVITVQRSQAESLFSAQVRYITSGDGYNPATNAPFDCGGTPCTATSYDFTTVKGELDFERGQTSLSFAIPIVDHGAASIPKTLRVSLYGPSPIGLGPVSTSVLTILNDDPAPSRDPVNPLGLTKVTDGNPLAGMQFYVDLKSEPAKAAHSNPALRVIASQPGAQRFGFFTPSEYVPDVGTAVSRYLSRAATDAPGTVPMLATYALVHGVRGNGDSPDFVAQYHNFVDGFARGIGSYRAVLFLEMDSIITAPGLNAHGRATRMGEINDAIDTLLANCPHLVIYLDAGAADAAHAPVVARLLMQAGITKIQGFFLNATHFDWTSKEIRFGEQVSRLTGGKHFVVNTGANGQGPLRPPDIVRDGNEVLCNPVGRGLGPKPTTHTGYKNVDAFAWTTNPGESLGQCQELGPKYELPGAPPTGVYWPKLGAMLVRNADFGVR
ncbi:MAG TPA: glycoside hydrolase family 6 protein [Solirubrobacteraceae bacterium]|nr:glycoside hydrolase family 6 protein [Solirubrobacteraceae bacterium]